MKDRGNVFALNGFGAIGGGSNDFGFPMLENEFVNDGSCGLRNTTVTGSA